MAGLGTNARLDLSLLLIRVVFGLQLALLHGFGKWQSLLAGATRFPDPLGIGSRNSLIGATLGEFICGLLLAAGLAGRIAAAGMGFTMAVAVFMVHANDPWAKKELAILFLTAAVIVLIAGSGRWSFDSIVWPRVRGTFGGKGGGGARRRADT